MPRLDCVRVTDHLFPSRQMHRQPCVCYVTGQTACCVSFHWAPPAVTHTPLSKLRYCICSPAISYVKLSKLVTENVPILPRNIVIWCLLWLWKKLYKVNNSAIWGGWGDIRYYEMLEASYCSLVFDLLIKTQFTVKFFSTFPVGKFNFRGHANWNF